MEVTFVALCSLLVRRRAGVDRWTILLLQKLEVKRRAQVATEKRGPKTRIAMVVAILNLLRIPASRPLAPPNAPFVPPVVK
jgi:hypothetical protein